MTLPTIEGRFGMAFDDDALTWAADFTWLDQEYENLVVSYQIDRGRQFELDRTDVGRATVRVADKNGILDPTNTNSPFWDSGTSSTKIQPLTQAILGRWNPVANAWKPRFRGFVEEYDYTWDPSQRINFLTISLVDIFAILAAIEMVPGAFGDPPGTEGQGQIQFDADDQMSDRIIQALGNAGIPSDWYVVFSGNVSLKEAIYSPGQSVMDPIQEAADGEFPGVANVYTDRHGRLSVHGRLARFAPVDVASGAPDWDFHEWQAGDGATVDVTPSQFAQIRGFATNRGWSKIINSAFATPAHIADADVAGQISVDLTSQSKYGIRSWSAQNLLTDSGLLDGSTDLEETKKFADYYKDNYAFPRDRITELTFRSMRPDRQGASENWRLLCDHDISDTIEVTIAAPGGGGYTQYLGFIEGTHESNEPLNGDYDNVTVSLDVSPRAYFDTNPFPTS